jgi:Holliday junction resolvase
MLIENGDTIYLTKEEVTLLLHYRNASGDDRRLAQKVLNISDN